MPGRDPVMTSRMMSAVRNKDSKAELLLRRGLHKRGIRYRLHARDLAGRPDIVVRKYRLAIFVDGDLWHGNAWRLRGLARMEDLFPNRTEWWVSKIQRNMKRDREVTAALAKDGWEVHRVWESEVLSSPDAIADRIAGVVLAARQVGRYYGRGADAPLRTRSGN